ncbi:FAD:protein FMN transferase [Luteolibacter sp. GHJ8]|uniref:FAD:protein FMN transferase n=1 Tax=Luteolibacter rhizosphaerae TaxID=2989719 RepID=A0ABT3G098_9BACT|nr:FAD:protein FMN transferase [Luteolibacter rhizosphaerae]MCW1913268.1 FAD:protein FMN transferase [Luteolibacter rhizosphaerae]
MSNWVRITIGFLLVFGSAGAEEKRFNFERPLMGTRFAITCYAEDEVVATAAANAAFAIGAEINAVASDYLPDSELMKLSDRTGETIKVSPLLGEVLEGAFTKARETDGAFDPTLGPLTKLWRQTRDSKTLPDPATLAKAQSACGWTKVDWDGTAQTIRFKEPGMQLDLGGIAKGFAADKMFAAMKERGLSRILIAAGGDLRLGEPPPGKTAWRVGLQTFDDDEPEEVVELSNCAVSTAGDLHQAVEIDGKRYSHIIDPHTGLGLTRRIAVSVIAPSGMVADGLDTGICVAGAGKADALGRKAGATRVIVRLPD